MESSLGGAAVMKAGNDFLSGVTALGKVYRLIQIKIQVLRQVLANSLRLDPCACRAQFSPSKVLAPFLELNLASRPLLLITVRGWQ